MFVDNDDKAVAELMDITGGPMDACLDFVGNGKTITRGISCLDQVAIILIIYL